MHGKLAKNVRQIEDATHSWLSVKNQPLGLVPKPRPCANLEPEPGTWNPEQGTDS
jgi:hypothetical protein